MQHAGKDEIIGVLRCSGGFADAVFAGDAPTDCCHFEKMSAATRLGKVKLLCRTDGTDGGTDGTDELRELMG
jgi:hypothetical protein